MASSTEQLPDDHIRATYEDIHIQIAQTAKLIKRQFVSGRRHSQLV